MTKDSENNAPEQNGSAEQLTAPSNVPPSQVDQAPFIPNIPLRELQATWEMLIQFKKAILTPKNDWDMADIQAVAMGMQMLSQMEVQYRAQVERRREDEKRNIDAIKAQIAKGGGVVSAKETVH